MPAIDKNVMPTFHHFKTPEEVKTIMTGKDIIYGEHATGGVIKFRVDRPHNESWSLPGCQTTYNRECAERCAKAIYDNQFNADLHGYKKVRGFTWGAL